MTLIREGAATIRVQAAKITAQMPVFYNPAMKLNRDIAILLINTLGRKGLRIADPLAGSGIRGIRFIKELQKGTIKELMMNDANPTATKAIKHN